MVVLGSNKTDNEHVFIKASLPKRQNLLSIAAIRY